MLREIIADTDNDDGTPVVRLRCPECRSRIDREYSVRYGERIKCDQCREPVLVTFQVEQVPQ
ncbi:hypothetical protein M0R89_15395 [Halorussus limi]|uniref:Uncharacterized protein n=2 Tax=Halorussus TaxID=1070314 RepID=A0A8U0IGX0_9EURY|nr:MULTISPECIES: hypothetical protein [Halorussus]UPV73911.1 hypothetical protein M0R89_15395 [Halorussus limi]UPV99930.1 hypothetical protein M0R88_15615 [Halorussus gelatinilyticus]